MTDIATVRELLRRAILTLDAIPDPEPPRDRVKSSWPQIVRATIDAYGAAPPTLRPFVPTPADLTCYLDVLEWLVWYERNYPVRGRETRRLFRDWARGAPMWLLRERCSTNRRRQRASRNTVTARLDEMVRTIAHQFRHQVQAFDELNELNHLAPNQGYGEILVEIDLDSLHISPKAVISAIPEPLSAKDEARAHKLLNKRLHRNHLAAMQRQQRTKALQPTLMAG